MRKTNVIVQRIFVTLLAIILLVMQESLIRYRHAHVLADGMIVWHSHPFGESHNSPGGKTHQHSPGSQFAFDQMASSVSIAEDILQLKKRTDQGKTNIDDLVKKRHDTKAHFIRPSRAPPLAA